MEAQFDAPTDIRLQLSAEFLVSAFNSGIGRFPIAAARDDLKGIEKAIKMAEIVETELGKLSPQLQLAFVEIEERSRPYDVTRAGFPRQTRQVKTNLIKLKRLHQMHRRSSKVDWHSIALGKECIEVWARYSNLPIPNTVHNDALGPFGRFLQDCLDVVASSLRPGIEPPKAGSVMRALQPFIRNDPKK